MLAQLGVYGARTSWLNGHNNDDDIHDDNETTDLLARPPLSALRSAIFARRFSRARASRAACIIIVIIFVIIIIIMIVIVIIIMATLKSARTHCTCSCRESLSQARLRLLALLLLPAELIEPNIVDISLRSS